MTLCPHCRQPMPARPAAAPVPDDMILRALEGGEWRRVRKRGVFIAPNLYTAARADNPRLADWNRWFVTGPKERPGYVQGPFPLEQVQRLVETGRLKPAHVGEDGNIHVWELIQK